MWPQTGSKNNLKEMSVVWPINVLPGEVVNLGTVRRGFLGSPCPAFIPSSQTYKGEHVQNAGKHGNRPLPFFWFRLTCNTQSLKLLPNYLTQLSWQTPRSLPFLIALEACTNWELSGPSASNPRKPATQICQNWCPLLTLHKARPLLPVQVPFCCHIVWYGVASCVALETEQRTVSTDGQTLLTARKHLFKENCLQDLQCKLRQW